ncbi:MAG TPA: hypothetical protein VNO30_05225 [Kofleriaceae bacterium]|nr:hypothetical protein [Kofleriaceae bacterium]
MRAARSTSLWLAAALACALTACVGGGDDDDEGERDAQAVGQVATALDAGGELSRLLVPLEASADLGLLGPDVARVRKVQSAITAFRALVANSTCLGVATDGATFLDLTFNACRIAFVLTLDGALHAGVAIEAVGGTPSAVVVSLSSPGLSLAGPVRTRRMAGELTLRHPIRQLGAPVELDAELQVSADDDAPVTASLGAAWTVSGDCVTITAGAQLSGELLGSLGPIALSGDGVQRCREECPTAGSVELSYGRGKLLAWTYTGAGTAIVMGPRGKRVEVPLACAGG